MPKHAIYLACKSNAQLRPVCAGLEQSLALVPFIFDAEDTWQYGRSSGAGFEFNITQTKGTRTIATWMKSAPLGVNFQVILFHHGPRDQAVFQNVLRQLNHELSAELQVYDECVVD